MKKGLTEMVFILDKSGSMEGLQSDTIGGFNSMIRKQKEIEGEAIISTVMFNHSVDVIHNRVDIKETDLLTTKDYIVGGTTALLDAIGRTVRQIKEVYAETLREDRPDKVVFVITTDGLENASREFTYEKVKSMIQDVKDKYHWEFLFLGANIDVVSEAARFGIDEDHAVRHLSDSMGTSRNFETINEAITSVRMTDKLEATWKSKIEEDFSKRKQSLL